jgi:hypothetical protein
MKTVFSRPNGMGEITVKVLISTFGNGPTGAKSTAYRAMQPIVEATNFIPYFHFWKKPADGLVYLPNTAITPRFFSESRGFLARAGVSHERPEKSLRAIDRTSFTPYEFDVIRDAYAPFAGLYVFLRSDESTASGVGLWHSDAMPAMLGSEGMMRAARIVKEILKSDFSRDVIAFKRRVGLPMEETPGVFIMPAVGEPLGNDFTSTEWPPFAPIYHLNIILNFITARDMFSVNQHLAMVGAGVGGANHLRARSYLVRTFDTYHKYRVFNERTIPSASGAKVLSPDGIRTCFDSEWRDIVASITSYENPELFTNLSLHVNLLENLARLAAKLKFPTYFELGLDMHGDFAFLQGAPISLGKVKKPEVPEAQKIFVGDRVDRSDRLGSNIIGRKVVRSDCAFVVSQDINQEIPPDLENYVLFVKAPPSEFSKKYSFADYSKAAAIIFIGWETGSRSCLATHLSGAARESGIVMMRGEFNKSFIEGLPIGVPVHQNLLVYANDAAEEGFVATM